MRGDVAGRRLLSGVLGGVFVPLQAVWAVQPSSVELLTSQTHQLSEVEQRVSMDRALAMEEALARTAEHNARTREDAMEAALDRLSEMLAAAPASEAVPLSAPPIAASSSEPWLREQLPLSGRSRPPSGPGRGEPAPTERTIDWLNAMVSPLVVSGEARSTVGFTSDDVILQRANGDLNERNFRILSGPFRDNTFDPAIFSRLRVNLDTHPETPWQLHSNISIDPWSFVGTTKPMTVVGTTATDSVDVQLKWWGATNTAINETFLTQHSGDSMATPEIEVRDARTVPTCVSSTFGNTFCIPSAELDYSFQPIRWFWTGYRTDVVDLRLFPLALQDQAVSSDDPLGLSNHHIYWEASPWLDAWQPGHLNTTPTPDDFMRGAWSDDLSGFTRDSELTRLTALRGGSVAWHPFEGNTMQAAVASPKTLWQPYDSFRSFVGMGRLKQAFFDDRLVLGGLYTSRWGYHDRVKDATNNVYAADVSLQPWEWLRWEGEGARSDSVQDHTSAYKTDARGWAWHNAVTLRGWEGAFSARAFATHMDEGFDPGLADYRHTRRDQFWGRHLSLKRPLSLLKEFAPEPSVSPHDLEAVRLGDGIDVGRDAVGVRLTGALWDQRWLPMADVRNVHRANGKYLETVARQENTVRPVPWLTAKTLFIYHDLPRTVAGLDPFLVDGDTGEPVVNAAIVDDRNPSLMTYSLGGSVSPTDDIALWGIWERTNDTTVGTDNFPRGLLNSASFTTFTEDGQVFRAPLPFLYGQGFFPQPPYPYYDIFRAGAYLAPIETVELGVDWTRNEFTHAGQIDDNLNHLGFVGAWLPVKRVLIAGRYVLSWAVDLADENAGGGHQVRRRHNVYGLVAWKISDDARLEAEFGVGALTGGANPLIFTMDPYSAGYPTLDTEHLVRVVYAARF